MPLRRWTASLVALFFASSPAGAELAKLNHWPLQAVCKARFALCSQFEVDDSCAKAAPRKLTADASASTSDPDPDYDGLPGVYRALADAGVKVGSCLDAHGLLSIKERYEAGLKSRSKISISCPDDTAGATGTTQGDRIHLSLAVVNKASHLSEESILFHESFHTANFPHGDGVDYTYFATSCCVETWSVDHAAGCGMLDQSSKHLGEHEWWLTADYLTAFAKYLKTGGREAVLIEVLQAADKRSSAGVCPALSAFYGPSYPGSLKSRSKELSEKNHCS